MSQVPPATPASGPPRTRPAAVVAVLAFAGIVVSLMQTLVVPLLPQLPHLLDASASDTAWAITATLLAGAVATPAIRFGLVALPSQNAFRVVMAISAGAAVVALVVAAFLPGRRPGATPPHPAAAPAEASSAG